MSDYQWDEYITVIVLVRAPCLLVCRAFSNGNMVSAIRGVCVCVCVCVRVNACE